MDTAILSQPELDVFLEAEKLSSVPNGNFTQPYATKYAARQLYLSLLDKAKVTYESDPNLSLSRAVYGYLLFKIGQIHVETDESGVGEGKLLKAKELLEKISHLPTAICAYLATLNQLGCLNAEWGKAELAEKQLSEAERIYMEQKALESESAPLDGIRLGQKAAGKLETIDEETNKFLWIKFEEIHTFTLYFLAQVFKVRRHG